MSWAVVDNARLTLNHRYGLSVNSKGFALSSLSFDDIAGIHNLDMQLHRL